MQGLISQSLEGLWTVSLVAANKRDGEKVFAEKGFQQATSVAAGVVEDAKEKLFAKIEEPRAKIEEPE